MPVTVLFQLLAALFSFLVCLRRIGDFDYWTHLALGRAYWRAGTTSIDEPFILSRLGQPLENTEWLFQILLYPLHVMGSDVAVSLAIALTAAIIFYFLAGFIPRSTDVGTAALAFTYLTATAVAVQFRFVPRPEVPAYLLFILAMALAGSWSLHPERRKMLALAAIFVVWAPLHVSWTIGAMLVMIRLLTRPRLDFWQTQLASAVGRIFIIIVAVAVILAGFRAFTFGQFVLAHITKGGGLAGITEMRPLWEFADLLRNFCFVAFFGLVLAWGDKEGRIGRLLYWSVAVILGMSAVRNVAIALLGMVPVALEGLGSKLRKWPVAVTCTSLLVALALLVGSLRENDPPWGVGVQWPVFPRDAATFVKEHKLPAVVFNNWDCGGYLDWSWGGAPPTFLDGRLGDGMVIAAHDAIVDGIDPAGAIDRLGVKTILLQPLYYNSGGIIPALFWILSHPEWQLIRASDAMVFVKGTLPDGVTVLPAYAAWRALYRQIELMTTDQAGGRAHLLYSRALALYFGGDVNAAHLALTDAKRRNPELLPIYRGYFGFQAN